MHLPSAVHFDRKLHDLRTSAHDIFHCARKHVNAADRYHVINSTENTAHKPCPTAAAGARLARDDAQITCPITDDRHSNASEVCQHELAHDLILNGCERYRRNNFYVELLLIALRY